MGKDAPQTAVVDERGRLVIPGAVRQALDMNPGDAVLLDIDGDELRIVSARRQRAAVAQRLRGAVKSGDSVDELIAGRRREAAREAEER